jgi:hypothetical protein
MSHCIYCNSTTYGKPCIFSPQNVHVHFDAPNKCIYCGSKVIGSGCIFNPFGKNHVRGPEFLANVKEQVKNSIILSYLYESIIKSEQSNAVLTPLSRFYKRLSGFVTSLGQPLLESFQFQSKPSYSNLQKEHTILAFELKERIQEQIKSLNETIKQANISLPQEIVEDIIVDAIMASGEKE